MCDGWCSPSNFPLGEFSLYGFIPGSATTAASSVVTERRRTGSYDERQKGRRHRHWAGGEHSGGVSGATILLLKSGDTLGSGLAGGQDG